MCLFFLVVQVDVILIFSDILFHVECFLFFHAVPSFFDSISLSWFQHQQEGQHHSVWEEEAQAPQTAGTHGEGEVRNGR